MTSRERERSLHEASFLAHFLHLHRASWRCDVVLESDLCLTYCVPLADSLCSFVSAACFIYFGLGGGLLVFKRVIWGEDVCACITALENNLF